jgi:hypothetical protein
MAPSKRVLALFVALLAALAAVLLGAATSSSAKPYHHAHLKCNPHANVHSHVHCRGTDYLPNDDVVMTIQSQTFNLGTVHADKNGNFNFDFTLPSGVTTGVHTVTGTGQGGPPDDVASDDITVTAPGGSGTGNEGVGAGAGTNSGSSGGLSTTGIAVISLGVVGLGLLVGGTVLVASGRRRRALV